MSDTAIQFHNILDEAWHAFSLDQFKRSLELLETARGKAASAEAERIRLASHNLTPRDGSFAGRPTPHGGGAAEGAGGGGVSQSTTYRTQNGSEVRVSDTGRIQIDFDWFEEPRACCDCHADVDATRASGFKKLIWHCDDCGGGSAPLELAPDIPEPGSPDPAASPRQC